mmetsp:Transcript_12344/g.18585  ORF Transcript_12344/g.18585 Transcript_12344/m.18585 type:complete len:257 (-) Transcript_12344:66-836(-)
MMLPIILFLVVIIAKIERSEQLISHSSLKACAPASALSSKIWNGQGITALFAQLPGMGEEGLQPRQLVSIGMQRFREGEIQESIDLFDRADEAVPNGSLTPFLWQRGISLYYADKFQEGSNQFRYDVKVNPLDVEEIVWDIACQSRLKGINPEYEMRKMSLPQGKRDRRRIMGTVYSLFRGDATEQDLAEAGHGSSAADEFYSLFYLGLYCESIGEDAKAANYMKSAAKSEYAVGRGSVDYMTSCAKIHCNLRHWT